MAHNFQTGIKIKLLTEYKNRKSFILQRCTRRIDVWEKI
jgi:hypothetical protein